MKHYVWSRLTRGLAACREQLATTFGNGIVDVTQGLRRFQLPSLAAPEFSGVVATLLKPTSWIAHDRENVDPCGHQSIELSIS